MKKILLVQALLCASVVHAMNEEECKKQATHAKYVIQCKSIYLPMSPHEIQTGTGWKYVCRQEIVTTVDQEKLKKCLAAVHNKK